MNKGRGFQNAWWLMLITLGVMLATEVPFAFVSERYNYIYMLFSEITLIIPVFVGFSFMNLESGDGRVIESVGFKEFPIMALPVILLLPVTAQYFINYATLPIQSVLTLLLGSREYDFPSGAEDFWQNVLLMCVLAQIFEEILCRGILMNLLRRYGTAKMLIYSSLGYALLHMTGEAFIPLFFAGILLGAIRITTDSVFASMLAHAASNLFSLLSITFFKHSIALNMTFMLFGVIGFPILVWMYFRKLDSKFPKSDLVQKTTSPTGISAAFLIILSAFAIFNTATFITRFLSGEILYDISSMFVN